MRSVKRTWKIWFFAALAAALALVPALTAFASTGPGGSYP
jgi:hypothetical protein